MSQPLAEFDLSRTPFSRRGSWLCLSSVTALHTTSEDVHLVSHVTRMHAVLSLVPVRHAERVSTARRATPAELRWEDADGGVIRAAFESDSRVRIRGRGMGLAISDTSRGLTPFTGDFLFADPVDGAHVFTSYETGQRYRIQVHEGELEATGSEALGGATRKLVVDGPSEWEISISATGATGDPVGVETFEEIVDRVGREFGTFLDTIAAWRRPEGSAVPLAAYVLWSATVSPAGFLTRESILMSKHWMDKMWSWDHAFNALAVAPGLPDMAIDQFLAPFDHQEESGAMPDSIAHSEVLRNFVKPPIHGWALAELRRRLPRPLSTAELTTVHGRLASWSRFWLDHRRAAGDPLPYYQHGNDSGWDNSTVFDLDRVLTSPDLAAFLVVQLEVLANLTDELELGGADGWRSERDVILTALLDLSDDEGFFARGALSDRVAPRDSLITKLPVVAADHLPARLKEKLVEGAAAHLTEWGPASQLTDTEAYESDGYWRGPIWAPSTLLIENGLRRCGAHELADQVRERFLSLCERSGFAENFDALTGEGLRDRAYTWTASVYLVMARDLALELSASAHSDEVLDRTT